MRPTRVYKPRAVLWEHLLLDGRSPLRRALTRAAVAEGLGREAFEFLPNLRVSRQSRGPGGTVERLELGPLPRPSRGFRRDLARVVGRATALVSWLGLSDLHWENVALGVGEAGQIVLTPIDVEMILADLSLPTETKLIADIDPEYADVCRHAAGLRRVLPFLGKPANVADVVAMAAAYADALSLLDRNAHAIANALAPHPELQTSPIRVLLRATGDYVRARCEPVWPPLLDGEAHQLDRGDIPYFFRLYGQPGIRYYADPSLTEQRRLPSAGDVPKNEPLLSLARSLRSPKRRTLREEGVCALLGAFDHPSFTGTHEDGGLSITFTRSTLTVRLPDGTILDAPRDLRSLVGSLYLPCACGEVRGAFVPEVTICRR